MNIDAFVTATDQAEAVLESAIAAEARGDRATAIGQAAVAVAALNMLADHEVTPDDSFTATCKMLVDSLRTEALALLSSPAL